MNDIDLTELTYHIQEGRADDPEIREALVRRFGPEIHRLAWDILPDHDARAENALGLTAAALEIALDDPAGLRAHGTIRAWLFSTLLSIRTRMNYRDPLTGVRLGRKPWLVYILRYAHGLALEEIAEITTSDPEASHRWLRTARRKLSGGKLLPGSEHICDAIELSLDGLHPPRAIDSDTHFQACEDCRGYAAERRAFEKQLRASLALLERPELQEPAISAILDSYRSPPIEGGAGRRPFPLRETLWAAGAVVGFLLLFLALNPVSSFGSRSPSPTATPGPPDTPYEQRIEPDYERLAEIVGVFPPPAWAPTSAVATEHHVNTEMAFSEDGRYAAFGDQEKVILIDIQNNMELEIQGHTSAISSVAFGGGRWLASASADGTIRIWDLLSERNRYILGVESEPISEIAYSADGFMLAAGGGAGFRIWAFSGGSLVQVREVPDISIRSMAFSPGSDELAAVDEDGVLSVWRLRDFKRIARFDTLQRLNTGIAFSPNGSLIATASMDGTVHIFDLVLDGNDDTFSGALLQSLHHPTRVSDLAWADSRFLLTVSGIRAASPDSPDLRGIYTWEVTTGLPVSLPYAIDGDNGLENIRMAGTDALVAGGLNRIVHRLSRIHDPITPIEEPASAFRAAPADFLLPDQPALPAPQKQSFNILQTDAAEFIGYAQVMDRILTELIPDAFTPAGASFDSGVATFAFTRGYAQGLVAEVYIRIRALEGAAPSAFSDDWIGPQAEIEPVQYGRFIGEKVSGEWAPSDIDPPGSGILRWTESALTRFRWIQGDHLVEIISSSRIGSEESRWSSLFQPLILAMMSPYNETHLVEYTVVPGDTCITIADRYGTTTGRIIELNQLDPGCTILADQVLSLPLPPAFGLTLQSDLDCDGSIEYLRGIPSPIRPNTEVFIGFVLEDIPDLFSEAGFTYTPHWTYSISDVNVTFFDSPQIFTLNDGCPQYIALTGFGGNGVDSGLRIFRWDGEAMHTHFSTDGFLFGEMEIREDHFTFQVRTLEYDDALSACTETIRTFRATESDVDLIDSSTTTGLACFNDTSPP